jgi:hypothetical protein
MLDELFNRRTTSNVCHLTIINFILFILGLKFSLGNVSIAISLGFLTIGNLVRSFFFNFRDFYILMLTIQLILQFFSLIKSFIATILLIAIFIVIFYFFLLFTKIIRFAIMLWRNLLLTHLQAHLSTYLFFPFPSQLIINI